MQTRVYAPNGLSGAVCRGFDMLLYRKKDPLLPIAPNGPIKHLLEGWRAWQEVAGLRGGTSVVTKKLPSSESGRLLDLSVYRLRSFKRNAVTNDLRGRPLLVEQI